MRFKHVLLFLGICLLYRPSLLQSVGSYNGKASGIPDDYFYFHDDFHNYFMDSDNTESMKYGYSNSDKDATDYPEQDYDDNGYYDDEIGDYYDEPYYYGGGATGAKGTKAEDEGEFDYFDDYEDYTTAEKHVPSSVPATPPPIVPEKHTPVNPTPSKPTPAEPTPSKPTSAEPTPAESTQSKSTPSKPTPAKPAEEPPKPSPAEPSPSKSEEEKKNNRLIDRLLKDFKSRQNEIVDFLDDKQPKDEKEAGQVNDVPTSKSELQKTAWKQLKYLTGTYKYCGPGTPILKRILDWKHNAPTNKLDLACFNHDLVYSDYKATPKDIRRADDELMQEAERIVRSLSNTAGDAVSIMRAGLLVINAFKAKTYLEDKGEMDPLEFTTKNPKETQQVKEFVTGLPLPKAWNLIF